MKIILNHDVFTKLEAARVVVGGHEYSGLGFVNVTKQDGETLFEVYDVALMDVGSSAFTEISAERILPLLDRPDAARMKLWWHAHPLGNDQPGKHNWSSTDESTARTNPLGGIPELVKWSISMVRTPTTWVGRFDRYKNGKVLTRHIPVIFCPDQSFINQAIALKNDYEVRLERLQKELAILARPFGSLQLKWINCLSAFLSRDAVGKKKIEKFVHGTRNKK